MNILREIRLSPKIKWKNNIIYNPLGYLLIYLFLLWFSGKLNYFFYPRTQSQKLEYLFKDSSLPFPPLFYNASIRPLKIISSLLAEGKAGTCFCCPMTTCFVPSFVTSNMTLFINVMTTTPYQLPKISTEISAKAVLISFSEKRR